MTEYFSHPWYPEAQVGCWEIQCLLRANFLMENASRCSLTLKRKQELSRGFFYKDTNALRVLPGPNHLSNSANLSPWELGYQQAMQGRGMRGVPTFSLCQESWKITQWWLRMWTADREGTKKGKDQKPGGDLSCSSVCTQVALERSSHSLYMNDPVHILFLKYVSFTKIFLASKMYLLWILQEILIFINNYFKGSI